MRSDMRGLELGTGSGEAVAAFDEAVQHFLEYRADTGGLIERAIEADPAFLMPRILRAGALLLMGTNTVRPMIDAELAVIDALETPRNPREELHERALLAPAHLAERTCKLAPVRFRIRRRATLVPRSERLVARDRALGESWRSARRVVPRGIADLADTL